MLLQNRTALVTGARRGVGLGIAAALVAEGAKVAMVDVDQRAVEHAAEQFGDAAIGVVGDVTSSASMQAAVRRTVDRFGGLDIAVANAGVGDSAPLGSIIEQQFDFIFGVNTKGAMLTAQAALPFLPAGGSIVLIGSTASLRSEYGMSLYGGSKAALRQMVRTWIREVKDRGVRINIVSPGAIDTPSLRTALAGSLGQDAVAARVEEMGDGNWIGRLGTPTDIGEAVAFLASDHASFITGVELFVDGGMAQTG